MHVCNYIYTYVYMVHTSLRSEIFTRQGDVASCSRLDHLSGDDAKMRFHHEIHSFEAMKAG